MMIMIMIMRERFDRVQEGGAKKGVALNPLDMRTPNGPPGNAEAIRTFCISTSDGQHIAFGSHAPYTSTLLDSQGHRFSILSYEATRSS